MQHPNVMTSLLCNVITSGMSYRVVVVEVRASPRWPTGQRSAGAHKSRGFLHSHLGAGNPVVRYLPFPFCSIYVLLSHTGVTWESTPILKVFPVLLLCPEHWKHLATNIVIGSFKDVFSLAVQRNRIQNYVRTAGLFKCIGEKICIDLSLLVQERIHIPVGFHFFAGCVCSCIFVIYLIPWAILTYACFSFKILLSKCHIYDGQKVGILFMRVSTATNPFHFMILSSVL